MNRYVLPIQHFLIREQKYLSISYLFRGDLTLVFPIWKKWLVRKAFLLFSLPDGEKILYRKNG